MIATLYTLAGIVLIISLSWTVRAWRQLREAGSHETEELMRGGVSLGSLWRGDVPRPDNGSLVTVREGIKMSKGPDGKPRVIQTRTISRDIC
ncbi:hypothetical protein ASE85_18995 [Sphingobium sp. Leaf26]|nr:hypothetical protein ASE85_18995 [Sphingobium sp. Leaf26]